MGLAHCYIVGQWNMPSGFLARGFSQYIGYISMAQTGTDVPFSIVTSGRAGIGPLIRGCNQKQPWALGKQLQRLLLSGWGRGLRAISAALGSWQQVWMMNGQLNVMEQIDHCITDHNLFISAKRAIHYPACHTAHVIARDKSPRPHSLRLSSHLTSS